MSVRLCLLAILREGPCYGNQLRREFTRRTAESVALNAGQVYATLERLARDGAVTAVAPNQQGNIVYSITEQGRAEVARWFTETTEVTDAAPQALALKLALAATLPGVNTAAVYATHRAAAEDHERRLESAGAARAVEQVTVAARIVQASALATAQATTQWIAATEALLATAEGVDEPLNEEAPTRGRPSAAANRPSRARSSRPPQSQTGNDSASAEAGS